MDGEKKPLLGKEEKDVEERTVRKIRNGRKGRRGKDC